MGDYATLKTADSADYYIGEYPVADGVFLNPVTIDAIHKNGGPADLKFQYKLDNPNQFGEGSIGFVASYNGNTGIVHKDSGQYLSDIAAVSSVITKYNAAIVDHNKAVAAFNTAADEWTAKTKNDLNAVVRLLPKTSFGGIEKPAVPELDITMAGKTKFEDEKTTGKMVTASFSSNIDAKDQFAGIADISKTADWTYASKTGTHSTSTGFLESSVDDTTKKLASNLGHAFGKLGQG